MSVFIPSSGGGYSKFARIIDSKTSGTTAQTLLANTWTTMEFTNLQENDDSLVSSLSSNQFALVANTFILDLIFYKRATASDARAPMVRLYNVTDTTVVQSHITCKAISGTNYFFDNGTDLYLCWNAIFRIVVPSTKTYRIEVIDAVASNLGKARSVTSTNEIYKNLDIWGK